MIDMMEKVDPNDRTKDREPEDFELRYFTEMEVAGLMGFPKDFSFPPDLTTRQVMRNKNGLQLVFLVVKQFESIKMICVREYFYLQRIMLLYENNKSTSCFSTIIFK